MQRAKGGDARLAILLTGALTVWTPVQAQVRDTPSPLDAKAAEALFLEKVSPVFKARCVACHGGDPKEIRGGLDLRSRAAMLRGGDSGEPAVVAAAPDESLLYLAVTREDPSFAMPPKENDKLAPDDVAAIRSWIEGGAPWPVASGAQAKPYDWNNRDGVRVATSGGLSPEWTNRRYKPDDLWAYRPLRKPPVPSTHGPGAPHPIDAFLARAMEHLGLRPAPPADRRALLRRATFDLTGLPPEPDEIESFLADPAPDELAFTKVVDRLLASPHYGEHWGRHWLDVARYADSAGFANDYERGNAWRFRDYVVRSFNSDKPYDRFVREQLAGDEIDPSDSELLIAVGFLRMGAWELTGMEVPKVARQRFLDDVTETVGQAFLAHALQCARCHDHKFDPVPARDYYRIQAVFAATQFAERPAPFLAVENVAGFEEKRYVDARKARYEATLAALAAKEEAAARAWCAARHIPYVARTKGLRQGVPEDRLPPHGIGFDASDFGTERIARKGLERLAWELDRYASFALSVYSGKTRTLKAVTAPLRMPTDPESGQLDETHILTGGDPYSPKDPVEPGVLSAVAGMRSNDEGTETPPIPATIQGRRKAFADWVSDPNTPLTPRVMVNRIWMWHFGRALAANPNNFGSAGKKPSHPELLDWLAAQFVERGWSVKQMHRLIMTSAAYRRAARHPNPETVAAKDPQGTSYAVFQPRRLEAEEVRDAMLAVSGELNPELGGIPIRPELDPEVALQPRQVMGTFASAWQPSPLPRQRHRRSLYALRLRGLADPFFEVFNKPGSDTSCERRETSTVTPQAFILFNGREARGRALALAARLARETNSHEQAIDRAFRLAFGRPPAPDEAQACLKHWRAMTERHQTLHFARPRPAREVVREAVEENTGVKFHFTEVLDAVSDFVSDLEPCDVRPEVRGLMDVCLVIFNSNEFAYLD